jgi:hypothetical protein
MVGRRSESGVSGPARIPSLHLPGGLKIDPPGSTRRWCCLLSLKSSKRGVVGARAKSGDVLHELAVGGEAGLSIGRVGGSSSGLSGVGATAGGTCIWTSRGGVQVRSVATSDLRERAKAGASERERNERGKQ